MRSRNTFDATEARVYLQDDEIKGIAQLRDAYHNKDVALFQEVLSTHQDTIMDDPFLHQHMSKVLWEVQGMAAIDILKSYSRMRLSSLALRLKMDPNQLQQLLCQLILEEKLEATIDQVDQVVEKKSCIGDEAARQLADEQRFTAMTEWATNLSNLSQRLLSCRIVSENTGLMLS